MRRDDAYSRITVTLPTFIIITLRHLVKDANDKHPDRERWCVSALLERWLSDTITKKPHRYAMRFPVALSDSGLIP